MRRISAPRYDTSSSRTIQLRPGTVRTCEDLYSCVFRPDDGEAHFVVRVDLDHPHQLEIVLHRCRLEQASHRTVRRLVDGQAHRVALLAVQLPVGSAHSPTAGGVSVVVGAVGVDVVVMAATHADSVCVTGSS